MRWVLRLVEAKGEGQSQSTDVMEIVRPDDLGNIADLGLTLAEAKVLQARVQQEVVAAQARGHAAQRPNCRSAPKAVIRQRTDEQQISTHVGRLAKAVRLPKADIKDGHIGLGSHGWKGQRHRTSICRIWRHLLALPRHLRVC
ncbi:hypothetical protein [Methylocapsa aurea]|uniref:hypothetical protein n=1 Tax=Methylocapsa aurea TaxID=663610 RepID=UPI0012EBC05F|nr:hypothetical protein [Methylocapsa aurea]